MLAFRREWGKGGGCAPCTPLGGGRKLALAGRAPFLTFPRVRGQGQRYPRRGAPPVPCWGNGGFVVACALLQRGDWLSLRRCPTGPPSDVFGNRGTRCTPGGGCAPAPCLGDGGVASLPSAECGGRGKMRLLDGWSCCGLRSSSAGGLAWPAPLSHRPTLRRFWKQGTPPVPPARVAPPAPCLGNGGFVAACALLQRGDWLGLRRCPTGPPSDVFGNRGTRCTPGGGCAPCALLGERGVCCGLRSPSAEGLAWRAPLSHRPTLQRYWKQGDSPCTPLCHTQTPISVRWLSSVSAQTRASRRSGLAPLSGVQVQSWSSRSSRPGPTWKTLPCS